MTKKKRYIYKVELSHVLSWDEEGDAPDEMSPILNIDGKDYSYTSARIMDVYRFYKNNLEELIKEYDMEDLSYDLRAEEIEVSDEEWYQLLKKEKLEYHDYKSYLTQAPLEVVVAQCDLGRYSWNDIEKYVLIDQSENFNMRIVCEKAGISYSTFRGFKYNHKPLSSAKACQLLHTMYEIGNDCWDPSFD